MGCDLCGASVGRVGRELLSGLDCDFWDFGRWAVISLAAMLGAWGGSCCLDWTGL